MNNQNNNSWMKKAQPIINAYNADKNNPKLKKQYDFLMKEKKQINKKNKEIDQSLFNSLVGIIVDDKIDELKQYMHNYNKEQIKKIIYQIKTNPEQIDIILDHLRQQSEDFIDSEETEKCKDACRFYKDIVIINNKLKRKEPITKKEHEIILNINSYIDEINKNEENSEYIKKIQTFVEKNFNKENISYLNEDPNNIKDTDKIYFDDYIGLFKICLRLFTYLSIFLIIFILLLSIIAFLKLIYDIIVNIISLFVNNDNLSRSLSLDFLSKSITRCTKDNLNDDRFFIITEQKQNIVIFNICIYVLYLLFIYIFLYFILFIYSKIAEKPLVGDPQLIFQPPLFITLLAFIIGYSIIHLGIYKLIFKNYIYSPYKELQLRELEIDTEIAKYILIYAYDEKGNENSNQIIVDNKFFDIIFDASRIDELNEIFLNGIITKNNDECLEQKIIIYNIYCYLREYIPFTNTMQEKFKEYCTSKANNKPKFENSDISITFVSMMNNNEIKMIRKYNEDLNYYNQIPDDKIEYFNKLNTSITDKIKNINLLILTNTNTIIPFFLTIFYIICIVLLNLIILYIIIYFTSINKEITLQEFNPYIYMLLYNIKIYLYDPIINYFLGTYR